MADGALVTRIAGIVLPIILVVAVGWFYGRVRKPTMDAANIINMDVFLPALVFSALSSRTFALEAYKTLVIGGLALVLGSGLLMFLFTLATGARAKTLVPPMMFRNSVNLGVPLMVLAFGEAALPGALVLGLVSSTIHFSFGTYMLDRGGRIWSAFVQPVVVAAAAGLLVSFARIDIPPVLAFPIEMLGQVSIPLMLFSLGVRLSDSDLRQWRQSMLIIVAAPAAGMAIVAVLFILLDLSRMQAGMLCLYAALPPAVLNYLFAERYNQEPGKVASIVVLSNLSAVVTIPLALAFVLPRFG